MMIHVALSIMLLLYRDMGYRVNDVPEQNKSLKIYKFWNKSRNWAERLALRFCDHNFHKPGHAELYLQKVFGNN